MRYGIEIIPFGDYADPRPVVELAVAAEAAGWDGVWIWDHLLFPWGAGDLFVMYAAIAAVTQRLKLAPGVLALPRYPLPVLARQLNALDRLSNGRLIFGAGMGAMDEEYARFGGPGDKHTRAEMLDEGLDVLTRLWTGESVTHHGAHYHVDGVALQPTPLQTPRPPIWIGGEKAPALRRAARWDGWIIGCTDENSQVTRPPEKLAQDLAYIRQHRSSAEPFDVAVDGVSQPGQPSLAPAYAQAGATWYFELIFPMRGSHEAMLERIQAGPPTY